MLKHIFFQWVITLLTFSSTAIAGGIGDAANEFWVDGPADVKLGNAPKFPDVAVDNRGRRVFVWAESTFAPAISAPNIVLAVFDRNDQSLIKPVKINTFDLKSQSYPRVAVSEDDSFLVIWQSGEAPDETFNTFPQAIRSQAFDKDANPVGGEQILSELNTLIQTEVDVDVAALRGGGYVAVWHSKQSPDTNDGTSIQGRMINSGGIPIGSQFQINNTKTNVFDSSVTELADGGFMAVWWGPEIHGRRFQSDGTPVGGDFQINTLATGTQDETDIATNRDGRVMVVWRDGQPGSTEGSEIRGRIFSSTLVALGNDFQINSSIAGKQRLPSVAGYTENGFFVVWESLVSTGNDNEPNGIEGRVVTSTDGFASIQFQVNSWVLKSQRAPSVGGKNGEIATAWESEGNAGTSVLVINGRSWSICGIFCNGFE